MKRVIATPNEDVVVFIIGLRINRLRSVRKWWPTVQAMTPMIKECYEQQVGLLSHEMLVGWRSVTLIQYWRSSDALIAYSHGNRHLTAWKKFNQSARASNAVGIFHETFEISNYETMYVNLPTRGLAKAVGESAIQKHQEQAKDRLAERKPVSTRE
ncbi:transcriptional regulator [Exiguobacterium sp. KRL4]|uniref:DUF4188 domain-containing protein n=1 Tax=Exiguobacterium sp. KRL4 TaxID=1914536 RepID=UPI0008F83A64|nr:DUF4188 domain-containing protein [Exiguobacterium sp. KRL4]OIN66613.1 transcriptional regulator [Exiguobacterium sp. KRL4]